MERLTPAPAGFRPVPRTGVLYVMSEAAKHGFVTGSPDWANLGQGAPETGSLPGGPERKTDVALLEEDHEYAPVDGLPELRDAVADLYNARYREGKKSQYTRENVAIVAGGRLALTRVVSTLGRTNVGHFLPDYTAYEELLDSFGTFVSIPVLLDTDRSYEFTIEELRAEILGRGLSAMLLSNPGNPTGKLVTGSELEAWLALGREVDCTMIFDEFYSHYIYDGRTSTSAASSVEDVDRDPVVILDGLTKNWRYPGWRVAWTVAPKPMIESLASAGSFLDGGCARPMQRAAISLLERDAADAEAKSIQETFGRKRKTMVAGLEALGIRVRPEPSGGFYCWGDLQGLPEGLRTGTELFLAGLDEGVIVVPGRFFDVNPGQRRPDRPSRFQSFARFSFGPSLEEIERGLASLGRVVAKR